MDFTIPSALSICVSFVRVNFMRAICSIALASSNKVNKLKNVV